MYKAVIVENFNFEVGESNHVVKINLFDTEGFIKEFIVGTKPIEYPYIEVHDNEVPSTELRS